MSFSTKLLKWYDLNLRDLPWRHTDNPYVIWIAEVIFQQTRISQGLPYFYSFLEKFPTVQDLAWSKEEDVLKKWQGLGYYSRARNLQFSAQYVVKELDGVMPGSYEGLLKLKGVGPYIAAEVASVCYGEVVAAVDGNVQRVLARYFGVQTAVNTTQGMKVIQAIANEHISSKRPGDFNQALMDMGATICTPKKPSCEVCTFSESCWALRENKIHELPLKEKKVKVRNRFFNYLIYVEDEHIYIRKRSAGDVWQGLFEPFLLESDIELELLPDLAKGSYYELYATKRVLSHQRLFLKFWVINSIPATLPKEGFEKVNVAELENYPVPKSIEQLFLSKEFKSLFH